MVTYMISIYDIKSQIWLLKITDCTCNFLTLQNVASSCLVQKLHPLNTFPTVLGGRKEGLSYMSSKLQGSHIVWNHFFSIEVQEL